MAIDKPEEVPDSIPRASFARRLRFIGGEETRQVLRIYAANISRELVLLGLPAFPGNRIFNRALGVAGISLPVEVSPFF